MAKSSWEARAERFMKQFLEFIPDYEDYDDYDLLMYVDEGVDEFNKTYHRKVTLASGSARLALLGPDYVIKMDYDFDRCKEIGGCEREYEMYLQLHTRKYAYLIAPIHRFEINGVYYYAMKRYHGFGSNGGAYRYNWDNAEVDFLRQYMTDLHDENVAMVNGKGVVVDYACPPGKYNFSDAMGYSCW